jgi:putative oxidoreductase
MQRLFSSFPNAWPGTGLLLLRMVVGIPVVIDCSTALLTQPGAAGLWRHAVGLAGSSLLLVGFWTPIGGALQALAQGYLGFRSGGVDASRLITAAIGISLIMLGPGAWSVDARLYGRKRIEVRGKKLRTLRSGSALHP